MTDAIFWDAHEELLVKLKREPTYEEVVDLLNSRFKENSMTTNHQMKKAIIRLLSRAFEIWYKVFLYIGMPIYIIFFLYELITSIKKS